MNDDETDDLERAVAFQDLVLPSGVPVLPGVDVGARFRLPDGAAEPVGNWLDVVALSGGRLALVVGEAAGAGIGAAATMGQISAVVRAGLLRDDDAAAALALADHYATSIVDVRGTTVTVAVIDPVGATASYVTAGHPPPLVVSASGTVEALGATGGGPLGVRAGGGIVTRIHPLAPGDVVLLASAAAHHQARADDVVAASGALDDLDADLDRTTDALVTATAGQEAIALVAAGIRPEVRAALHERLPSDPDTVSRARALLDTWLDGLAASPMDRMSLTHAASELVTNAVEHGGDGTDPGTAHLIDLDAELDDTGVVRVDVRDHGTWRAPSDDIERGRGLAMATGLVDGFALTTDATGTCATLRHHLRRPLTIEPSSPDAGAPVAPVAIARTPGALALSGAFGEDDVERVAAEIRVATRGGTTPLVLDLSDVSRLSTGAVRFLADLTSGPVGTGPAGGGTRVRSGAGSVVQRTLDSARVPHDAA